LRTAASVLAVGGLFAAAAYFFLKPDPELAGVVRPPDRGREHRTGAVSYDTPTPTSGPHAPTAPRCGFHEEPLALPLAVHALEHGVVVVWFSDDRLAAPLRELMGRFRSHVVVSPNPRIRAPIVATAWHRLKRYQAVTDDLEDFVRIYRGRGPERVKCDV
jgi:hypothetical protein